MLVEPQYIPSESTQQGKVRQLQNKNPSLSIVANRGVLVGGT